MLSVKNFCAKSISGAGTNVYFNQNKLSLFHKEQPKITIFCSNCVKLRLGAGNLLMFH